jgi:hypothetical protein
VSNLIAKKTAMRLDNLSGHSLEGRDRRFGAGIPPFLPAEAGRSGALRPLSGSWGSRPLVAALPPPNLWRLSRHRIVWRLSRHRIVAALPPPGWLSEPPEVLYIPPSTNGTQDDVSYTLHFLMRTFPVSKPVGSSSAVFAKISRTKSLTNQRQQHYMRSLLFLHRLYLLVQYALGCAALQIRRPSPGFDTFSIT